MTRQSIECAVMFADVCGSTRLYETRGDEKAQRIINECLEYMAQVVQARGGVVVKTIGDEIMARFPDADSAVKAAIEIQETTEGGRAYDGERVSLRTGLHAGPAILDGSGDVFGDAVNIAARMAGIAKATQIITTGDTVALLSDEARAMAREFDRAMVKGKSEALRIYEVVWEQEDVTRIVGLTQKNLTPTSAVLKLIYAGREVTVDSAENPVFVLGRSARSGGAGVAAALSHRVPAWQVRAGRQQHERHVRAYAGRQERVPATRRVAVVGQRADQSG